MVPGEQQRSWPEHQAAGGEDRNKKEAQDNGVAGFAGQSAQGYHISWRLRYDGGRQAMQAMVAVWQMFGAWAIRLHR